MRFSRTARSHAACRLAAAGAAVILLAAASPAAAEESHGAPAYQQVTPLLQTTETVAGQPIVFPGGIGGITSVIVTLGPGEATAWHRHDAPMFAYILEGELTVTYTGLGDRAYAAGDALMEAQEIAHRGRNTGPGPVRILTVFMTGDGSVPTTPLDGPGE